MRHLWPGKTTFPNFGGELRGASQKSVGKMLRPKLIRYK
jgi:hypothetical protein